MNNSTDIAIVIPIYRDFLDKYEQESINSIIRNFNDFEIVFAAPENLTFASYQTYFSQLNNYRVVNFNQDCFKSIDAYNQLLLDSNFYSIFSNYKYILICQLDVYVFRNDLLDWMNKGYDYIGAPWTGSKRNFINLTFERINKVTRKLKGKTPQNIERLFKVGNGGFSLRKVEKFIKIAKDMEVPIKNYLAVKPASEYHIEDVFWSLCVPKNYSDYKIPDWKEALNFCIDRKPELSLKFNNNQLPMACHRFNQPKAYKFWSKYF